MSETKNQITICSRGPSKNLHDPSWTSVWTNHQQNSQVLVPKIWRYVAISAICSCLGGKGIPHPRNSLKRLLKGQVPFFFCTGKLWWNKDGKWGVSFCHQVMKSLMMKRTWMLRSRIRFPYVPNYLFYIMVASWRSLKFEVLAVRHEMCVLTYMYLVYFIWYMIIDAHSFPILYVRSSN